MQEYFLQGSPLNVISKARTEKMAEQTSCRLVIIFSTSPSSITITNMITITNTIFIHIRITTLRLVTLSCPDSSHTFTASACCEGGLCFLEHGNIFVSRIFWYLLIARKPVHSQNVPYLLLLPLQPNLKQASWPLT